MLRNDLAMRWLAWRALLVAVFAFGWLFLVGFWATRRLHDADQGFGTGLLALGAPAVVVAGALLLWETLRQRRVSRLLHAWVDVIHHAAVQSLLRQQGLEPEEYLQRVAVRTRMAQIERAEPLRGDTAAPPPAVAPAAGAEAAWARSVIAVRRGVWAACGGLTLFFGLLYLAVAATGGADANMSGEKDTLTGTVTVAGLGVLFVVTGGRTLWKSVRLRSRTNL